jgi:hypothetical protein
MATFYKNAKLRHLATSATTLYTAESASTGDPTTAIFKSILVSNDDGSTATTVTLTLTDSSSTVFVLYNEKAVATDTTVELLTQPLVVEESEILKVTAANADILDVVASYVEVTR